MKGIPKGFTVSSPIIGAGAIPKACQKAITLLDKLKFKKLLPTRDLAAMLGLTVTYFSHHATHPSLDEYRQPLQANAVVWGSKRTIAELKKLNAENE